MNPEWSSIAYRRDAIQYGKALDWIGTRRYAYGKRIIFTNGVFDLFHSGHAALFRQIELEHFFGCTVVVGLNSDESTKRIKGPSRPFHSEIDRAKIVSMMRPVDQVIIFDEDTPYELLNDIRPDLIIKGRGYSDSFVIASPGANVQIMASEITGQSTTSIIEKLNAK